MKTLTLYLTTVAYLVFACVSCKQSHKDYGDRTESEQAVMKTDPFTADEDETTLEAPIPKDLNEALNLMMDKLTSEDRKFIEEAGEEYSSMVHFD